ncbi:MAG: hypothetical protein HY216_03660 [Candidatus Rokubacteria bacterium]|nr:hypothetical protein [Candidatus Rokubacteria bacterium]
MTAPALAAELFINGTTTASLMALDTVSRVRKRCAGLSVRVIDVRRDPSTAESRNVMAVPTLIMSSGDSETRLVGDFTDSDVERRLGRVQRKD